MSYVKFVVVIFSYTIIKLEILNIVFSETTKSVFGSFECLVNPTILVRVSYKRSKLVYNSFTGAHV